MVKSPECRADVTSRNTTTFHTRGRSIMTEPPTGSMRLNWLRHPITQAAQWGLLIVTLLSAAVLGLEVLSEEAAFDFSSLIYVIAPAGSGLVVMLAALTLSGRHRLGWFAIGSGVLCWGVGEIIWVVYEYVLQTEVPYPGWADVFYVLGYPLLFIGVMLLPHVKPRRLERIRLSLDALAGTIAISAVMWVTYLSDQIYLDPEAGFLEQAINMLYPLGDVGLLITVMILAMRRSAFQFDIRLLALGFALVVSAIADIVYLLQVETDSYVSGNWVDSLWLLDYAAMVLAGIYLLREQTDREQVDRSARIWQVAAPYLAIIGLFGLTLWDVGGSVNVLQFSSAAVGALIIGRQAVAIRENRELVERQRDDLIASISHELRTPLTSITGYTSLLESDWDALDPSQRSNMVATVNRQAEHVSGIVTDLVALARGTLSATDLAVSSHDVADLVAGAVEMVPVDGEQVDLAVVVEPELRVAADGRRFTQVLVNLLTNAIRYGNGEIRVVAGHDKSGNSTVAVHDNGPGVPRRYEEAIWDRFERGAHRLDASIPGSGIGLPIARSLAEAHGGSVRYERSQLLGGACFTISLPASASSAVVTEESKPRAA